MQRSQNNFSNDAKIVLPSIALNQPQLIFCFSDDTSCVPGLEFRAYFQRQQNIILLWQAILKAQGWLWKRSSALETATILSTFSVKCNHWAREVVLEAGCTDFLEAYPIFKVTLPPLQYLESISITEPFPLKRKRKNVWISTPAASTSTQISTSASVAVAENGMERE